MNDLRQAAQMALEALEYHVEQTRPIHRTSEAIAALRAALTQPEPGYTRRPRQLPKEDPSGARHD